MIAGDLPAGNRIAAVDGLRAVAVLGVLWAHVWAFSGNPQLPVGRVGPVVLDMNRAVAIVGTGVDLFFVISGFCMYLIYARRQSIFSWGAYGVFVKRRWLRIAPAFYVAATVAAVGHFAAGDFFPWFDLASHFTFTHILFPGTGGLSAPFWSLATEWHFYLVLPLFIWAASRLGFWPVISLTILVSMAIRTWIYLGPTSLEVAWKSQLPTRLVEFAWGMCVARMYTSEVSPPRMLCGYRGFLLGAAVAYLGRTLMVTEVVTAAGSAGTLLKIASEPVLTLGYGIILWNVIATESIFRRCLSHTIPTIIGRWSYSSYLWHWWPSVWICGLVSSHFGATVAAQYLAFAAVLAILLPASWLSYRLLEVPYFEASARMGPASVLR